jgi:hypothetical protein
MAIQDFINTIGNDLIEQVVKTVKLIVADVHARQSADRF